MIFTVTIKLGAIKPKGDMGQGQRSHGSRLKVTWVKVKSHVGQGYDISRWAHINVKMLHFLALCEYFMSVCLDVT